jgi:pimeloyl-ACP methyl ester carboxylesterase
MIPSSSFHEIPDAGHLVIEEQPDLLVEKIHSFLTNE